MRASVCSLTATWMGSRRHDLPNEVKMLPSVSLKTEWDSKDLYPGGVASFPGGFLPGLQWCWGQRGLLLSLCPRFRQSTQRLRRLSGLPFRREDLLAGQFFRGTFRLWSPESESALRFTIAYTYTVIIFNSLLNNYKCYTITKKDSYNTKISLPCWRTEIRWRYDRNMRQGDATRR